MSSGRGRLKTTLRRRRSGLKTGARRAAWPPVTSLGLTRPRLCYEAAAVKPAAHYVIRPRYSTEFQRFSVKTQRLSALAEAETSKPAAEHR